MLPLSRWLGDAQRSGPRTASTWQGWRSPLHDAQGTEVPAPTAIYEWRAAGPSRLATLLYPTPAGQDCPVRAIAAGPDVSATGITLTLVDGSEVALDEADYPV